MESATELGPFELGACIGTGGMASVYRAHHRQTGIGVAVKVNRWAIGRRARQAFHREVQAQAELTHPGIVYLFEYDRLPVEAARRMEAEVAPGSPYVAMELAERGPLFRFLPLTRWATVAEILMQVLDALAYSHARGVVHRDLKPENLLLFDAPRGGWRVKVTDFGIAHAYRHAREESEDHLAEPAGTPAYMAPEQVEGRWRAYGPWTDLYALGCIAWELVSGRPPLLGDSAAETLTMHQTEERPPLDPHIPVPDGFEQWVHRAMAVDPAERFQCAADAARLLGALAAVDEDPRAVEELGEAPADGPDPDADPNAPTRREAPAPTELLDDPETQRTRPETRRVGGLEPEHPAALADESGRYTFSGVGEWSTVPEDWRVAQPEAIPTLLTGTGLGLFGLRETPFVDRDAERDRLWEALRATEETDEPRVVLIVGDAGVGKSRLVDWMATRAAELGAAKILRAVHTRGGDGPIEGIRGLIRRAVRGHKLDRDELFAHLLDRLPDLPGDDADRRADARALTELAIPAHEAADTEATRFRFASPGHKCAVVSRLVRRLARRRPALVWLDDAQWGDLALTWVSHLLESTFEQPAATVAVTLRADVLAERPSLRDRVASLEAHAACTRLDLRPLQPHHHRQFVERLLPLSDRLAERLARRSEGTPLFAVQVLGHLLEEECLVSDPDGLRLEAEAELDLPADIHELWLRRLLRLADDLDGTDVESFWRTMEMTAALGREVEAAEWREVCRRSDREPVTLQHALVDRGLAERTAEGWRFAHGLLVDSLERRARREGRWRDHHRRCARLLARLHPDAPEQTAARRASHWIAAEEPARAIAPLLEEAQRLRRAGDSRSAREILERRERLLDDVDAPPDDRRRVENTLELAQSAGQMGDQFSEELVEKLRAARQRAREMDDDPLLAGTLVATAFHHRVFGAADETREFARRAVRAADRCGDEASAIHALKCWGWADYNSGDLEAAREQFADASDRAARIGHTYLELETLRSLAWVAVSQGDDERAGELFGRLLDASRETGYRWLEANSLNGLAELARFNDHIHKARHGYMRYGELARAVDRPVDEAISRLNLAQVELRDRAFDEAAARLAETERRFEPLSEKVEPTHLVNLAHLTLAAGTGDWESFDDLAATYADGWPEGASLFKDHPWLLEMAGDYAADHGERERADRVWQLAAELWRRLDDEEAARRTTAKTSTPES